MSINENIEPLRPVLKSFLRGYLNCRGQQAAVVAETQAGYSVRYAPGMSREREHFVLPDRFLTDGIEAADWVTAFYESGAAVPQTLPGLVLGVREFLMIVELPGAIARRDGHDARLLGEADRPKYDVEPGLPSAVDGPDVFQFAAFVEGAPAAAARYGIAEGTDVVVDRVETLERFHRRGIGTGITAAVLAHAAEHGARRAILISSVAGQALYARFGFRKLAEVGVYGVAPKDG